MVKAVIIEPKQQYKSFCPYFRNDRYLSELFKIPIINGEFQKYWNLAIERIILSYAAYWSDFKKIAAFIKRHPESRYFWITNEYNLALNSAVATSLSEVKNFTIIANFVKPNSSDKKYRNFQQLNLNTLVFKAERAPPIENKKYNTIYYGMYRPDRESYFQRYFDDNEIIVSTSPKNLIHFKKAGVKARFIKPFYWSVKGSLLSLFKYSLYLEDVFTHTHYNYPANRFYEGITFGAVQLFDINCLNTFKKAGYDISNYIVKDSESLKKKTSEIDKDYEAHLKTQLQWRKKAAVEKRHALIKLKKILLDE